MKTMLLAAAAALSLGVGSALTSANAHQMTGSTAAMVRTVAENEQQDVRTIAENEQQDVRLTAENEQQDVRTVAENEQQDVRTIAENEQQDVRLQVAVYTPSGHGKVWNDEPIG